MKNLFKLTALCLTFCCSLQSEVIQAYGIIKPTKNLPVSGILHFKDEGDLEMEGYFSKMEPGVPLVISVWNVQEKTKTPFCIGPNCDNQLVKSYPIPESNHLQLGVVHPDATGYGEINIKLKGVNLSQLNRPNLKLILQKKGMISQNTTPNLSDQRYSFVELRWIED